MSARALEALDRLLDSGDDADDVLRTVVAVLVDEPGIDWAGICFLDDGDLELGPQAGQPDENRRIRTPIVYGEAVVGELAVDGEADRAFLDRVAVRVSAHVLLGWDTRGEAWEP